MGYLIKQKNSTKHKGIIVNTFAIDYRSMFFLLLVAGRRFLIFFSLNSLEKHPKKKGLIRESVGVFGELKERIQVF
jgi:hypothetical protein